MSAQAKIITLSSIEEMKSLTQNLPKKSVILIDVDDTLITPKTSSFRVIESELNLIDEIKKDKHLYPNYEEIMSNWRLSRKIILVEDGWPQIINDWKNKYKVFALTKMDTGSFGNIKSMEEWRYNELKNLGITFSQQKNINIKNINSPSHYKGIFMTGKHLKSETISTYLSALDTSYIVFIDDKIEYLEDVAQFCDQNKIPFMGILYRGVDNISIKLDPKIKKIQKEYLIREAKWLEDDQAISLLK